MVKKTHLDALLIRKGWVELQVSEIVKSNCMGAVEKLGYELYEVSYRKEIDGMNLTLYIENPSGAAVTLEDCEKVSNVVEPILDKLNPMGEVQYNLNVASLGLDWPIVTERDFARNLGKKIEVKLYSKQDGKKEFVGELKSWTDESVTILVVKENKEKSFVRKDIANIRPHIEF